MIYCLYITLRNSVEILPHVSVIIVESKPFHSHEAVDRHKHKSDMYLFEANYS